MSRLWFVALVALALIGGMTTDGFSQRDSAAKARGEVGRGFWSPQIAGRVKSPSLVYGEAVPLAYPVAPAVDGYRSFSYEPLPIQDGDSVIVGPGEVRIMLGDRQVGTLMEGQEFRVIRTKNGWLGAVIEQGDREVRGWIWNGNVRRAAAPSAASSTSVEAVGRSGYRSFSYVPAAPIGRTLIRPMRRPSRLEVRLRPGTGR